MQEAISLCYNIVEYNLSVHLLLHVLLDHYMDPLPTLQLFLYRNVLGLNSYMTDSQLHLSKTLPKIYYHFSSADQTHNKLWPIRVLNIRILQPHKTFHVQIWRNVNIFGCICFMLHNHYSNILLLKQLSLNKLIST